ncbi:MAG: hypothetical protein ACYTJ0_20085, partial [Planctomycetota bacterium]
MQRTMTTRFASALVLMLAPAAMGDVGEQLAKIVPEDGGEGHRFGRKLAMSGTTALVSAPRDSPLGLESGSVYVYDLSAPSSPVELVKIVPGDGDAGDQFGSGLKMEGHIAVIGAPLDDDNGEWSGSAYVFDLSDPANPTQLFKLLPEDGTAHKFFGSTIALDGTIGLFGSANSAYLFDLSTGQQLARFFADDGAPGDNFGSSAALSGTLALVGAGLDDDNGTDSGSAYVFDVSDPATPVQLAKIVPEDGAPFDWFGATDLEGTTAIIGAFRADVGGDTGAAYLYDLTDPTNPRLMSKFRPEGHGGFGGGARFAGNIVVFPGNDHDAYGEDSGAVYVFDISVPCDPEQVATLFPDDPSPGDRFGSNPAISNGLVIAGAWGDDDNGEQSGSAYVLDVAGLFPCPADLDGDGAVGVDDLIIVILLWGTDDPAADVDGDGQVGVDDLLEVILSWGLDGCVDVDMPGADCNCNGVDDSEDIATGSSMDCNGNGVPDECDLLTGGSLDCNDNSIPDACDIEAGSSADCNG